MKTFKKAHDPRSAANAPSEAQKSVMRSLGARHWEDVPCDIRLQVGSVADRTDEAARQGVVEVWETTARRDHASKGEA